jgi:cytochrome P450
MQRSSAPYPQVPLRRLRRDPLVELGRLTAEQGDLATFSLGRQRVVYLATPQLVEHAFVRQAADLGKRGRCRRWWLRRPPAFVEGELFETHDETEHARARRTFSPAYNRGRAEADTAVVAEALERLCVEREQRGGTFDLSAFVQQLFLAAVLASSFKVEIDLEEAERVVALRNRAAPYSSPVFGSTLLGFSNVVRRPRGWLHSRQAELAVRNAFADYLARGGPRRGSLQPVLDRAAPRDPVGLVEGLVVSLVDAPAILLTVLLQLAERPDLDRAVRDEVDDGLGDRLSAAGELERLDLCRGVALEGLRLGAGWMLGRVCQEPFALDGLHVEPGDWLLASPHLLHRDHRYWPDAERIDAGRWRAEAVARRSRYAFLTFGVSTRVCTGRHLVTAIVTAAVAVLARRRLVLEPQIRAISWRGLPTGGDVAPTVPPAAQLLSRISPQAASGLRL